MRKYRSKKEKEACVLFCEGVGRVDVALRHALLKKRHRPCVAGKHVLEHGVFVALPGLERVLTFAGIINKMGLNILYDGFETCFPAAPKALGAKHISNPDVAPHFDL